ncbi:hypothetical protein [Streptomyces fructofermentans]|uniref:Integral membrane protein n=1 Tax=Streptomyces fructofermentans TaxID=152141 RepID=A0A918NRK5_9ACTN|nr:hypothetical protein [Streptomyces fructofermentans]GGX90140.1 hypothetical protein GCM10010515_66680 [Streptomyces fructofermentans]
MRARPAVWVLFVAALFGCLQLANVSGRDTPDSRNYLSYGLSLGGAGKAEATHRTIEYVCASRAGKASRAQSVNLRRFRAPDPGPEVREECRKHYESLTGHRLRAGQTSGWTAPFASERFMRIFEVRPGFPLLLVPFVTVLGATWGLWAAGVCVAAAGGVLVFLVLRTVGVPVWAALTGQVLYYVLPTGATAMRPMTEGTMLALTLTALWGCALLLRGRRGAWPVALSLALLFTVKHSQALFLAVCLAAACAVLALYRRRAGRPVGAAVRTLLTVSAAAAAGTVLLSRLLRYPSESESLQDLLTDHYNMADRERPWPEFLRLEANFWTEWLRRQFLQPLLLALLAAGGWGALRYRPAFGALLAAAAGTGVLAVSAHPDIAIDRLWVMVWLLPVVGVPLLLTGLVEADSLSRGLRALPSPGAPPRTPAPRTREGLGPARSGPGAKGPGPKGSSDG